MEKSIGEIVISKKSKSTLPARLVILSLNRNLTGELKD